MSETLEKVKDVAVYADENAYSHNAVVELLQDGDLMVVVQEQKRRRYRTHVDPTSKAILLRSKDGGHTWDPATRIVAAAGDGEAINDPSIRQLSDGTLILDYFKWRCGTDDEVPSGSYWGGSNVRGLDGEHYAWLTGVHVRRSSDGGRSWSEEIPVPAPTGDCTAVSDPVIELPNGEVLIPMYTAAPAGPSDTVVMRSGDGGRTWKDPVTVGHDPSGYRQYQEPSLLYLPSGKLICMMRVHLCVEQEYGHYLFQSVSEDLGRTWTPPEQTAIWGHPPHLLRLASGSLLCVYGYRRIPYGIRACLSRDEGETWDVRNELVLRSDGLDRDVGYPTSVQLPDGTIFTVWYQCRPDPKTEEPGAPFFDHDSPLGYIGGTLYREVCASPPESKGNERERTSVYSPEAEPRP